MLYLLEAVGRRGPMALIKTTATFVLLERALGEPIDTVDVSMFSAPATTETALKLNLRRGAPVLVREHIGLDSGGRIVLFGNSIYRGNLRFRKVFRRPRPGT